MSLKKKHPCKPCLSRATENSFFLDILFLFSPQPIYRYFFKSLIPSWSFFFLPGWKSIRLHFCDFPNFFKIMIRIVIRGWRHPGCDVPDIFFNIEKINLMRACKFLFVFPLAVLHATGAIKSISGPGRWQIAPVISVSFPVFTYYIFFVENVKKKFFNFFGKHYWLWVRGFLPGRFLEQKAGL